MSRPKKKPKVEQPNAFNRFIDDLLGDKCPYCGHRPGWCEIKAQRAKLEEKQKRGKRNARSK